MLIPSKVSYVAEQRAMRAILKTNHRKLMNSMEVKQVTKISEPKHGRQRQPGARSFDYSGREKV